MILFFEVHIMSILRIKVKNGDYTILFRIESSLSRNVKNNKKNNKKKNKSK